MLLRHVRTAMLEVLDTPFIRAARGHGISRHRILFRHALPVAINPIVSLFGFSLASLLSISLLTEVIMSWPGLGPLLLEAVLARDIYVVIGATMFSTLFLVMGTAVADILLYASDSRIHPEEAEMKRISLRAVSLVCLGVIHLSVLLAGFFSPYDFAAQDRELPYCPPTRIHWVNKDGRLLLAPVRLSFGRGRWGISTLRRGPAHPLPYSRSHPRSEVHDRRSGDLGPSSIWRRSSGAFVVDGQRRLRKRFVLTPPIWRTNLSLRRACCHPVVVDFRGNPGSPRGIL